MIHFSYQRESSIRGRLCSSAGLFSVKRRIVMSARKRIEYVDVAKGIAILCVVAGHTFAAYDPGSLQNKFIYSFHMPLFFILSGFFYKPQEFKKSFLEKGKKPSGPLFCDQCSFVVWWPCIRAALKTCLRGISFRLCTETGSTPKIALSLFDVKIVGMTWFLRACSCARCVSQSGRIFKKIWRCPCGCWYSSPPLQELDLTIKSGCPFPFSQLWEP